MTQTRARAFGSTPPDEGSARHKDLCLETLYTHKRQSAMPLAGFEPAVSTSERTQTHALDRGAVSVNVCGQPNQLWTIQII